MKSQRLLLRLLHGELPEAEARTLRERLASDPELAAQYSRLNRVWEGLAAPAPAPVPLGFTARVMAATREAEGLGWSLAPRWVRTTAAAALALGIALGAGLSLRMSATDSGGPPSVMYDSYLAMMSDTAAPPPDEQTGGARP